MKNKIIISSILTIAMCLSMIAGSTFALFTSESKVNIAVTSGEVNVTATVSGLKTSSLGVEQTAGAFANGGSATLDNGTLTLDKLTPGDKASFTITAENKSNVSVKYRITWSVAGDLAPFLTATVNDNALISNSTAWALWEGENTKTFAVVVELLDTVGNDAQGKRADISFKVEAVQGNAVNETVTNVAQLQASLDLGVDNITLANDITLDDKTTLVVPQGKEVTLNLNGNTITGTTHKSVGHVVKNEGTLTIVGGTISSTAANGGSAIANSGTLTVVDATLNGARNADGSWPSYTVNNTGVMTVNNSTITSYHGAVASYNAGAVLTLNNCEIDMVGIPGFTSHGIYTYNDGQVIVNGGTYANKAADQAASGASVINGNVVINSGNFSGRLENYYGTPVIKGGTFTVKPNAKFVSEGHIVNDNGNGTWSVLSGVTVGTVDALNNAIATVENGATIVLSADIAPEDKVIIPEGKTVTIDLNGKTVNGGYQAGSTSKHIYAFENRGHLTLKNGTVNARGVSNYGTLVVESGTYNAIDTNGGGSIWAYTGSETIINGGEFYAADVTTSPAATTLNVASGAKATINGGKFYSNANQTYGIISSGELIINDCEIYADHGVVSSSGTLVVNGGKFVQRGNLVQTSSLFYITSGTTTITGGTFNFNVEGKLDSGLPVYCAGGSVAISGGTFTGYVTEMISSWGGTGSASVTGGTFDKDPVYVADGYKAVENNGVWTVVAE